MNLNTKMNDNTKCDNLSKTNFIRIFKFSVPHFAYFEINKMQFKN